MKKYRKKPVIVEAEQWFKLGDVPEANIRLISTIKDAIEVVDSVDLIKFSCESCGRNFKEHGIIQTLEGSHLVCPGDYIIKGIKGEFYSCKPDVFKETYEEVSDNEDEGIKKYIQDYIQNLRKMGTSDYRFDCANADWMKYYTQIISSSRDFTKEEAKAYNESISKLFVRVDENIYDDFDRNKDK
jgi:hypothetical protein